ncbi:MAG: DUF2203 domain-containing protein [Planctomycetota bacterium]
MDKLFTLDEANRALPLVRSITRDAVSRYRAVKSEINALSSLNAQRAAGAEIADATVDRQDQVIARQLYEMQRLIDELEAIGCRLRDYQKGVVDFPAALMHEDQFAYYCWILGEGHVTHWHSEEEGYDRRRLVSEKAST